MNKISKKEKFPDDKIRIILSAMAMEDSPIVFDKAAFHTAVFDCKKKYPNVLQDFVFSVNGTSPYSDLLERVLMRGYISGVINYSYDDNVPMASIRKGTGKYVKYCIEPNFAKQEVVILKEIGRDISEKMPTYLDLSSIL